VELHFFLSERKYKQNYFSHKVKQLKVANKNTKTASKSSLLPMFTKIIS
jgi:hypothetical protein